MSRFVKKEALQKKGKGAKREEERRSTGAVERPESLAAKRHSPDMGRDREHNDTEMPCNDLLLDPQPDEQEQDDDWPEFKHDWDEIKKRIYEEFGVKDVSVNHVVQGVDPGPVQKRQPWISATRRRRNRRIMAANRRRWAEQAEESCDDQVSDGDCVVEVPGRPNMLRRGPG